MGIKRLVSAFVLLFAIVLVGAGCSSEGIGIIGSDPRGEVDDRDVYLEPAKVRHGATLIKPSDIHETGQGMDTAVTLTDPTFVTVDEANVEGYLIDDIYGVSVFDGDTPKFYSFQILAWHEVVEDVVNDQPVSITYSPFTDSALPVIGHGFASSGYVWNSNGLLFDRETETLWSPALKVAVYGERAGEALEPINHDIMTWGHWKERYANGLVLSSDTGHERVYGLSPYGDYLLNEVVPFPRAVDGLRVQPPKQIGFGVEGTDAVKMYYKRTVENLHGGVKNDQLGSLDVVVWVDSNEVVRAHQRGMHTFTGVWADGLLEGRTRWEVNRSGNLVSGDETLEALPVLRTFWFLWASLHPDTELFGYLVSGPLIDGPVAQEEDIEYEEPIVPLQLEASGASFSEPDITVD